MTALLLAVEVVAQAMLAAPTMKKVVQEAAQAPQELENIAAVHPPVALALGELKPTEARVLPVQTLKAEALATAETRLLLVAATPAAAAAAGMAAAAAHIMAAAAAVPAM